MLSDAETSGSESDDSSIAVKASECGTVEPVDAVDVDSTTTGQVHDTVDFGRFPHFIVVLTQIKCFISMGKKITSVKLCVLAEVTLVSSTVNVTAPNAEGKTSLFVRSIKVQ